MTNNQFTDEQLQYFSDSALGVLQRDCMSSYEIAASKVIIRLVAELQERRKADSENLLKERQRVIDGLCTIGETAWEIEEYMKKWDAEHAARGQ